MNTLFGLSAAELVARLPAMLPQIRRFTFTRYVPAPGLDQRVSAAPGSAISGEVERLRRSMPEVLERMVGLSALVSSSDQAPEATIAQMLRHDDADESAKEFTMEAEEVAGPVFSAVVQQQQPGNVLALVSRCVGTDGERMHIPVLDFHVPPSDRNQRLVEEAGRHLGLPHAAVLMSGRSYHLYGLCALTESEWLRLMLRALLLSPIVDSRYLAHRILANRGVLRLTSAPSKPATPVVVSAY
jgi:hypothetical protein